MPIRHALRTAIADDPGYDVSKDEWNAYQPGENVLFADFTLAADQYDVVLAELAVPSGIEYILTAGSEVAIL